jgi:hypothetical protein
MSCCSEQQRERTGRFSAETKEQLSHGKGYLSPHVWPCPSFAQCLRPHALILETVSAESDFSIELQRPDLREYRRERSWVSAFKGS